MLSFIDRDTIISLSVNEVALVNKTGIIMKRIEKDQHGNISEYDSNNNVIYRKDDDGCEYWQEYDDKNNIIHYRDNDAYEYWKEYDDKNNIIYYHDETGLESWYTYDSNGVQTRHSTNQNK